MAGLLKRATRYSFWVQSNVGTNLAIVEMSHALRVRRTVNGQPRHRTLAALPIPNPSQPPVFHQCSRLTRFQSRRQLTWRIAAVAEQEEQEVWQMQQRTGSCSLNFVACSSPLDMLVMWCRVKRRGLHAFVQRSLGVSRSWETRGDPKRYANAAQLPPVLADMLFPLIFCCTPLHRPFKS
jgi:hypothetical protein